MHPEIATTQFLPLISSASAFCNVNLQVLVILVLIFEPSMWSKYSCTWNRWLSGISLLALQKFEGWWYAEGQSIVPNSFCILWFKSTSDHGCADNTIVEQHKLDILQRVWWGDLSWLQSMWAQRLWSPQKNPASEVPFYVHSLPWYTVTATRPRPCWCKHSHLNRYPRLACGTRAAAGLHPLAVLFPKQTDKWCRPFLETPGQ